MRSTSNNVSIAKFRQLLAREAVEGNLPLSAEEELALEVLDDCHGGESHTYDTWQSLFTRVQGAHG